MMKDKIEDSFDLVLNRHVSIHLGLLDSIQVNTELPTANGTSETIVQTL